MAIVTPLLVLMTCCATHLLAEARAFGTTIIRLRHVELHPEIPARHLHHHHHHYYHNQPPGHSDYQPPPQGMYPPPPPPPPAPYSSPAASPLDSFQPQPDVQGIPVPDSYMPQPVEVFQSQDSSAGAGLPRDSYLPEPQSSPTPPGSSAPLTSSYYPNSSSPESPADNDSKSQAGSAPASNSF